MLGTGDYARSERSNTFFSRVFTGTDGTGKRGESGTRQGFGGTGYCMWVWTSPFPSSPSHCGHGSHPSSSHWFARLLYSPLGTRLLPSPSTLVSVLSRLRRAIPLAFFFCRFVVALFSFRLAPHSQNAGHRVAFFLFLGVYLSLVAFSTFPTCFPNPLLGQWDTMSPSHLVGVIIFCFPRSRPIDKLYARSPSRDNGRRKN